MLRRETVLRGMWLAEAGAVGWFFVQALRFLFGALYSHVSSADIVVRLGASDAAGAILPEVAQVEVIIVAVALLTPLLTFVLGRRRITLALTAAAVAVGRVFMTLEQPVVSVLGAAIVVAGAVLYLAALARQQPGRFAVTLTLGFALDQVVRAVGQTFDPTWSETFLTQQTALSIILFLIAVFHVVLDGPVGFGSVTAYSGVTLWGGLSLGGLLFIECALLALPNAVARWSGVDYTVIAPWLVAATVLPLAPAVREVARRFLTLFDAQWRGWLWLAFLSLLIVIGNRFSGAVAAAALVVAQLLVVLSFWWVVSPVGRSQRDLTGLAWVLGFLTMILLVVADFFTYEYAFVRELIEGFAWLGDLLRAMRGLGVIVALVALALVSIPVMDTRRRVPWQKGPLRETWGALAALIVVAVLVAWVVLPPRIPPLGNAQSMRVATYNIHGGYSLYFDYSLNEMAQTIRDSGADVVLLQEVDAGRLISNGVDQAHWLGRQLNMQVSYFPTNESLQGLAALSRFPITLEDGTLLTSQGLQTGVQRIQIRPDEGVLDLYNTWLGLLFAQNPDQFAEQEQDQDQQLREVLAVITNDHPGGVVGRIVLGGTFNNTPDSDLYAQLVRTGFNEPFADRPLEESATWFRGPTVIARFDYLWLRNIRPMGLLVSDTDSSDHRLAVVELNLE